MAKPFNRKAFKATNTKASKAKEKEAGIKGRSGGSRETYHKIEQGDNKFRFYPYHPEGGGQTYFEFKKTVFLPIEVDKWEDGEKTDETEIRRKPVFNAKVHGDYPKDLVEEYISLVREKAEELDDADKKDLLDRLYHYQKGVKWNNSFVVYADRITDDGQSIFGILEFSNAVKKEINKITGIEGEKDEMDNDPFTDPDDGIAIIINKTGKRLETEYTIELDKQKSGKFSYELVPTPLKDEQLERFMEKDPLFKRFNKSFKRVDFEKQVEGLMRVDEDNEFGVFESEEFIKIMDEISDMIPEDEENSKEEKQEGELEEKPKKKSSKSKNKKDPEPEPEEEEEDDFPEPEPEEEEEDDDEQEEEEKPKKPQSTKDRLAEIQDRINKKSKE